MGLDTVELVLAFEEEFGIKIDNATAEKMRTPRDVVDYMVTRRDSETAGVASSPRGWERPRIAQRVKEIVIAQLGIAESEYREDGRFVEDFGAD